MNPFSAVTDLASIIELSVAPVFLLAGVAGFLNVMSGRLGRIIDRARVLEHQALKQEDTTQQVSSRRELKVLWRRVTIIHWSIGLCTAAGLLVCVVIACLFVGYFWLLHLDGLIVTLFVMALLSLIIALILFLKEVQLSTRTMRISRKYIVDD